MVETVTSDLNVILAPLTAAPGADLDNLAQGTAQSMSSDLFRRELAELERICEGLPEPRKSELASTISSLQANFDPRVGVSASLAVALQEARVQARFFQTEVSSNDAADLAGAIASLDQYNLSVADRALVESRIRDVYAGNWESFQRSYDNRYEDMPAELRGPIEETRNLYVASPEHAALASQLQSLAPEELARRIAEEQGRYADAGRLASTAPGEYRHQWRRWRDAGVTADPASAEAIRLANAGDFEGAERAMRPIADRYYDRVGEIVSTRTWPVVQRGRNSFIETLSPEARAEIQANPSRIGHYISAAIEAVNPEDAQRAYTLAHGDMNRMPEQYKQYWLARQLTDMTKDQIRDEVLATDRVYLIGLHAQVERNGLDSLTNANDRRAYEEMTRMIDDSLPLIDQVRSVSSLARRVANAGGDSEEYTTGMAALNFAYARSHGGTLQHDAMMQRQDEQGRQYQREFRQWQAQQLGRTHIADGNQLEFLNNKDAIAALGREIMSGAIEPNIDANGNMSFYNTSTFETRSTFLTSRDSFSELSTDYNSMMRDLYREAIRGNTQRSQEPGFAELVRNLDVYRMQTQPEGREIIRELWEQNSTRTPAEMLTAIRPKLDDEREGLQEYAGLALSGRDERTMAALERSGALVDGRIDAGRLMQAVDNNKSWTGPVYQAYNRFSYDELIQMNEVIPNTNGHTTRELAEARMISAVATEMRSAHSVEHIGEAYEALRARVEGLRAGGQAVDPALTQELASMEAIINYNPITSTVQQDLDFQQAVRSYMMRDAYVYEKEVSDQYLPESDRLNLVRNATTMLTYQLYSNPNYLREHQEGQSHTLPAQENPAPTAPQTTEPSPDASSTAAPATRTVTRMDARENEGSGIFDGLNIDPLERAIIGALSGLSEESRQTLLGDRMKTGAKDYNEKTSFISYNEVENILRDMRDAQGNLVRRPDQIADVNGNGFDVEDIRAALSPNATPLVASNDGPANGRA